MENTTGRIKRYGNFLGTLPRVLLYVKDLHYLVAMSVAAAISGFVFLLVLQELTRNTVVGALTAHAWLSAAVVAIAVITPVYLTRDDLIKAAAQCREYEALRKLKELAPWRGDADLSCFIAYANACVCRDISLHTLLVFMRHELLPLDRQQVAAVLLENTLCTQAYLDNRFTRQATSETLGINPRGRQLSYILEQHVSIDADPMIMADAVKAWSIKNRNSRLSVIVDNTKVSR